MFYRKLVVRIFILIYVIKNLKTRKQRYTICDFYEDVSNINSTSKWFQPVLRLNRVATQVLVGSPKLNNENHGQYIDRCTAWEYQVLETWMCGWWKVNGPKFEVVDPSSNSCHFSYIHILAFIIEKIWIHIFLLQLWLN